MATATSTTTVVTIAERHFGNLDEQRVAFLRRERLANLATQAERNGVQLERETATQWVAWQDDIPGECDLVGEDGCTCGHFRAFGWCQHQALLLRSLGRLDGVR